MMIALLSNDFVFVALHFVHPIPISYPRQLKRNNCDGCLVWYFLWKTKRCIHSQFVVFHALMEEVFISLCFSFFSDFGLFCFKCPRSMRQLIEMETFLLFRAVLPRNFCKLILFDSMNQRTSASGEIELFSRIRI